MEQHVELVESTVRLIELNAATRTKAVAAYIEQWAAHAMPRTSTQFV